MKVVNISQAKASLSKLITKTLANEEILITRMGQPVARLSRYKVLRKNKRIGAMKNKIQMSDDFDSWSKEEAKALGIVD